MKELLLFMTDFYGYSNEIIKEIEKNNINVTWFLDKINLTQTDRMLRKINKEYADKKFDKYFESCLEMVKDKYFDEILIIFGGNFFKKKHIDLLRKYFPNVKIVYYAWDSVSNFPLIENLLSDTDISFTFDPQDAKKYKSKFLPLFYINRENLNVQPKYDVSTVMSYHVEKSNSLKKILTYLPKDIKANIYLKVRDKFYYNKLKIFNRKDIEGLEQYFNFKTLKKDEVTEILESAKVIIDCPLPSQIGLTMRTFEALAQKRKLITTNTNIKEYEFYTPNNIFIIEENKQIPQEFWNTKFDDDFALSSKYSLEEFVKKLIIY